jgi:predicted ATPase
LLDYITIKGFKSIASIVDLRLRPINVMIGANGSGKSNFLGVFDFFRAISEARLQNYVIAAGGAEKVLHFGSKTTKEIEFLLVFRKEEWYRLALSPAQDDGLFPSREAIPQDDRLAPSQEVVYFTNKESNPTLGIGLSPQHRGREAGISNPEIEYVRRYLKSWWLYHLSDTSFSSPMRKTAKLDDNHFLRADGSNLPAFLYFLRETHKAEYDLIVRTVQRVAPFFDDFRLEPRRLKPDDIRLKWRHKTSDQDFDASSLSDGTLRFIVLATLFLQPEELRPSIILVDEPELGLHPYAIEILAALVRQASATTQVILSTQSTLLLDHFEPEDVLVAERIDGGTKLRRLEAPQLAKWLEDYSLGQLWEKNEFGGRPVPR